ncbi:MAG: hypothetical protein CUN52_01115 [Phototrophicales bacterium]|nr:MAG: hypothetical protein CUN52_01115 [Phototrophicales bacterium]
MTDIIPSHPTSLAHSADLTFNFVLALPGRASSPHTQRAYYRWVDTFLVMVAGMPATRGDKRIQRMMALPVAILQKALTPPQVRAWLGMLVNSDQHKQALGQARAAIITLADLLAEAGWLDDYTVASLSRVRVPRAEEGQRPGRWLSIDELHAMLNASRSIATSEAQAQRNVVVMTMLCTLALRREELSAAKWGDISIQNNRHILRVHGKGKKSAIIDLPQSVINTLQAWNTLCQSPDKNTPIIRRIWKGGGISKNGLSADGIWFIVGECAKYAGIDHVAPHDLRRSVAGALYNAEVPIEKISMLLRHANIAVTERYLNKLPHANMGAVMMSDLLGWNDADWLTSSAPSDEP